MEATATKLTDSTAEVEDSVTASVAVPNDSRYKFTGPVNTAVPSQQALTLWLAAVATIGPVLLYALLLFTAGAWLLFNGLVQPVFSEQGYGFGSLISSLTAAVLLGLGFRPLLFPSHEPLLDSAASADAEVDLQTLVTEVAEHIGVEPPADLRLTAEPVIHLLPAKQGPLPSFSRQTLIVGVPVMMALSQRQLGGAVAHELAHFAVIENRRLRQAVVATRMMLYNATYREDRFDHALNADESVSPALKRAATLVLNVGRWPLKVMAALAEKTSHETVNEVEFHADWFQVELVGADGFRATADDLHLLAHTHNEWIEGLAYESSPTYPSDLPRVIYDAANRIRKHKDKLLRDAMLEERTLVGGPHAPNFNRIDRMTTISFGNGLMQGDAPSFDLLLQPAVTARQTTVSFLRDGLGLSVADDQLLSEAAINRQLSEEAELNKVLDSYLLGFYLRSRFLPPGDPGSVLKTAVDKRVSLLEGLCDDIRRASPEARSCLANYDDAVNATLNAAASAAIEALSDPDADGAAVIEARKALKNADRDLSDAEQRFAERLALGVATSLSDAVREDPHQAAAVQKAYAMLVGVQSAFANEQANMLQIREALAVARAVNDSDKASTADKDEAIQQLTTCIDRLRSGFASLPDPLAEPVQPILRTIDERARGRGHSPIAAATEFVRATEHVYLKVMVRLAEIALATEERHGIKLKLID